MAASRASIYDIGPPCESRAVDAFVRMGMAGIAWGLFMGSYDAVKEGHHGVARLFYVAKSSGRNGLGWGCFGGAYMGLTCGIEGLRKKKDWMNATIAGALTGAMAASVSSGAGSAGRILATAALASTITTTVEILRPVQYPPTGN